MNRRNFLKTLGAVVGTAIAAPAVLLAAKPKNLWMAGKGGGLITGPYIDLDAPVQWRNYSIEYNYSEAENKELLEKFRKAFKNTRFIPPVSRMFHCKGVPIYFKENLPL